MLRLVGVPETSPPTPVLHSTSRPRDIVSVHDAHAISVHMVFAQKQTCLIRASFIRGGCPWKQVMSICTYVYMYMQM